MKQIITKNEVLIRLLIILLVFALAYYSGDSEKQIVSVVGFVIAFGISLYLHKHFFPFVSVAIACYAMAASQELWSAEYTYLPITKLLWSIGNILLPLGFMSFLYRIIFKYKIVDNEN